MRRLTDGGAPWGTVRVWPASPGLWERMCVTVYPPGTSTAERRAMQCARSWPVTGAVIGFAGMVAVGAQWPILGPALIILTYVGGFWIGAHLTHDLRMASRTIVVSTVFSFGEMTEFGDSELLKRTRQRLEDLESRRLRGDVDSLHYEAEWADIYFSLPLPELAQARKP